MENDVLCLEYSFSKYLFLNIPLNFFWFFLHNLVFYLDLENESYGEEFQSLYYFDYNYCNYLDDWQDFC